jgi:DNA-directed RNA polymerase subunit K/omega
MNEHGDLNSWELLTLERIDLFTNRSYNNNMKYTNKTLTNTLDMTKCAANIGSRFDLILVASLRVRELKRGFPKKVNTPNGPIVSALQEIEAGHIGRDYLRKVR